MCKLSDFISYSANFILDFIQNKQIKGLKRVPHSIKAVFDSNLGQKWILYCGVNHYF
jgi:hypothetical protein